MGCEDDANDTTWLKTIKSFALLSFLWKTSVLDFGKLVVVEVT